MWQYNYNNESTLFGDELMHYGVPGMKWKDHVYANAVGAAVGADLTYKDLKSGANQYKKAFTAEKQMNNLVKATERKGVAGQDSTFYIMNSGNYSGMDSKNAPKSDRNYIAKDRGERAKMNEPNLDKRKHRDLIKAAKAYDNYKQASSLKGRAQAVAKVHNQRKKTAKARRLAIRTASKGARTAAYADLGISKAKSAYRRARG